jgi:predicted kinase
MSKIILCRGIQASGKSTYAKSWVEEDPEHRVRFNNDDIRNMLGKYWVPSREHLVRRIKVALILEAMETGYDIIVDNMNLNPKEVEWYEAIVRDFKTRRASSDYSIEFKDFKTPLEECLRRDSLRSNPIGFEVIINTYNKYKKSFYDTK